MSQNSELDNKFHKAASDAKKLTQKPSDNELLSLYGLYKQSLIGDNITPSPSIFDFKGKYKWDAWNKNKGVSKKVAMLTYIDYVGKLQAKYNK